MMGIFCLVVLSIGGALALEQSAGIKIQDLGSLLSGLGTLTIAIFAIWAAKSELEKWRKSQSNDRRQELSGRMVDSLNSFISAYKIVCLEAMSVHQLANSGSTDDQVKAAIGRFQDTIAPKMKDFLEFQASKDQCELYFPDVIPFLERIWDAFLKSIEDVETLNDALDAIPFPRKPVEQAARRLLDPDVSSSSGLIGRGIIGVKVKGLYAEKDKVLRELQQDLGIKVH